MKNIQWFPKISNTFLQLWNLGSQDSKRTTQNSMFPYKPHLIQKSLPHKFVIFLYLLIQKIKKCKKARNQAEITKINISFPAKGWCSAKMIFVFCIFAWLHLAKRYHLLAFVFDARLFVRSLINEDFFLYFLFHLCGFSNFLVGKIVQRKV